jgi:hypothetical protein
LVQWHKMNVLWMKNTLQTTGTAILHTKPASPHCPLRLLAYSPTHHDIHTFSATDLEHEPEYAESLDAWRLSEKRERLSDFWRTGIKRFLSIVTSLNPHWRQPFGPRQSSRQAHFWFPLLQTGLPEVVQVFKHTSQCDRNAQLCQHCLSLQNIWLLIRL